VGSMVTHSAQSSTRSCAFSERSIVPDEKGLQCFLHRLLAVKGRIAQQGRCGGQVDLGAAKVVPRAGQPGARVRLPDRVTGNRAISPRAPPWTAGTPGGAGAPRTRCGSTRGCRRTSGAPRGPRRPGCFAAGQGGCRRGRPRADRSRSPRRRCLAPASRRDRCARAMVDLVCLAKIRWRIERDYQELKDEIASTISKAVAGGAFITTAPYVSRRMPSSPPSARGFLP
jgi:hypothetical protein